MTTAKEWKEKGNALVKEKKYKDALDCYTKAIEIDPNEPILYSNRSAMHFNLSEFNEALIDAETAISINSYYAKAYLRKGKALEGLNKSKEALETYKLGLEKDKENAQLLQASKELESTLNNPLLNNYPKLFTDPRTAYMMNDPQFRNMVDVAIKDQRILMQMAQTDFRFLTVFTVLNESNFDPRTFEKSREEEENKKREQEVQNNYNSMNEKEKKEIDEHIKDNSNNFEYSLLKKQNEEYKNKINYLENREKELENIIKQKDKIINEEEMKKKLLERKIKELQKLINNINDKKIKDLENEIKLFRKFYNFLPEEKLLSLKVISVDQQIDYDIISKNTELFSKIEGDLYNKYENYRFTENYFLVNGNKINRHLNLKDNNIRNNDTLTLCIMEEE